MDMESHLTREQAQAPINIHHPEEDRHHEKGTTKVVKKVKEKAKKIKDTLTGHGHHHEHDHRERHIDDHDEDEDEGEDDEELIADPELHGAPMYESAAIRSGFSGHPSSQNNPGESHVPAPEEMVPPGTKVFPVVSSSQSTEPIDPNRLSEPMSRGPDASGYGFEGLTHPARMSELSDREESRQHLRQMNWPLLWATEDVIRDIPDVDDDPPGHRNVNIERTREGMHEDPAAPGGGSRSSDVFSNYQTKVTDPTGESEEVGVTPMVESLGRMKVTDVAHDISSPGLERELQMKSHRSDAKSEHGVRFEESPPTKSHERDDPANPVRHELLRSDLPTGSHGQFSPEFSPPKPVENPPSDTETFDSNPRAPMPPKQSSYTDKIVSATAALADKAAAAKDAVASKLGCSGEEETTPGSAMGYGKKMASTVTEALTPVYGKVKETGSSVMSKMPLSSGCSGETQHQGKEDKGVSARDYLTEKLKPGEEDRALSEVISEKLHLGGEKREKTRGTVTESVTVEKRLGGFDDRRSEKEKELGEKVADDVNGGGMVEKLRVAVTTWLGGTTEDVVNKSTESVQESSQSLGSKIGTRMGIGGSGSGSGSGSTTGGDVGEKRLRESGN